MDGWTNDQLGGDPYAEAVANLEEGDYEAARKSLEKTGSSFDPPRYDSILAEVHFYLRQYDESARLAKNSIAAGFSSSRVHAMLGATLLTMGLPKESEAEFRKTSEEDAFAVHLRAWAALHRENIQEAERLAERGIILGDTSERLPYILLTAQSIQGDLAARQQLRLRWDRDRTPISLQHLVIDAWLRKSLPELEELVAEARIVLEFDVDLADAAIRYYLFARQFEKALDLYESLSSSIQELPRMLNLAGYALMGNKQYRKAAPLLDRAFNAEPTRSEFARALSRCYLRMGRIGKSLSVITRHVKLTQPHTN